MNFNVIALSSNVKCPLSTLKNSMQLIWYHLEAQNEEG